MISYCDDCGEYLGDTVDGRLYKFGKLVTEEHLCPGQSAHKETGLTRDYLDQLDIDASYEAQRHPFRCSQCGYRLK